MSSSERPSRRRLLGVAAALAVPALLAGCGLHPLYGGAVGREVNPALAFDRAAARGMRLDIASGTAMRFEPCQTREVQLVAYAGTRTVIGFRGAVMGKLEGDA